MPELKLHEDYNREAVHKIFAPDTPFTRQAGSWGLHGIIEIPDRQSDFVLFVTFGRAEGGYEFDEGISTDGVLRWQSQPRQKLTDNTIIRLVGHDDDQQHPDALGDAAQIIACKHIADHADDHPNPSNHQENHENRFKHMQEWI